MRSARGPPTCPDTACANPRLPNLLHAVSDAYRGRRRRRVRGERCAPPLLRATVILSHGGAAAPCPPARPRPPSPRLPTCMPALHMHPPPTTPPPPPPPPPPSGPRGNSPRGPAGLDWWLVGGTKTSCPMWPTWSHQPVSWAHAGHAVESGDCGERHLLMRPVCLYVCPRRLELASKTAICSSLQLARGALPSQRPLRFLVTADAAPDVLVSCCLLHT